MNLRNYSKWSESRKMCERIVQKTVKLPKNVANFAELLKE